MPKSLKVGFLGTGGIARAHMKNLLIMQDVEVVAACSRHANNAATFLEEFGVEGSSHDSITDMLSAQPFDVLVVAIPPGAHDGQVEEAARAGVALFLEKPITLSVAAARSQQDAIEDSGVVSMVGYMNRFGAAVKKLKGLIDSGEAGKPTLFQGRYFCNSLHSPWWITKEMAGGQIVEQIIHTFDLTLHLFGEVSVVSAFTANICHQKVESYSIEDTSVSTIQFKNGALATIAGSNCAIPGKWINDFRVVCENLTVDFTDAGHATFHYTNGDASAETVADDTSNLAEEMSVFLDCVRENRQSNIPVSEGVRGVALTAAIAQSADLGGVPVRPESE